MVNFLKAYLLAVFSVTLTATLVIMLLWAYNWFIEREIDIGGVKVQEYISKEGKFTVFYNCDQGVKRIDFEPGVQK